MHSASIYLDYAGSTPVHPALAQAAVEWFHRGYGNPAASHPEGLAARVALDTARGQVATALACSPDEIVWTSGGTESNNWALFGSAPSDRAGHVVVSAIEHKSVLQSALELQRRGHSLSLLPVGADGILDSASVERALRPETFLVSVMLANNETGMIQPLGAIAKICREHSVRLHCDAVAAVGKLPIDLRELDCDLLSISGHKVYAPKGCGILFVRSGVELAPLIHGCGQQGARRSGTENTPAAVALGGAFELLARGEWSALASPRWRDLLARKLRDVVPTLEENGRGARLPNTLSVAFPGVSSAALQSELARRGVSCTAGAAGAAGSASHVLLAMGHSEARARATLRFTTGLYTTEGQVLAAAAAVESALRDCRSELSSVPQR